MRPRAHQRPDSSRTSKQYGNGGHGHSDVLGRDGQGAQRRNRRADAMNCPSSWRWCGGVDSRRPLGRSAEACLHSYPGRCSGAVGAATLVPRAEGGLRRRPARTSRAIRARRCLGGRDMQGGQERQRDRLTLDAATMSGCSALARPGRSRGFRVRLEPRQIGERVPAVSRELRPQHVQADVGGDPTATRGNA